MTVDDLIKKLLQVSDKNLLVRLEVPTKGDEYPNYWLEDIVVHNKGDSGYEQNGEVTLIGGE